MPIWKLVYLPVFGLLAGCLTMSGTYKLQAVDAHGKELSNNMDITAEGRLIYPFRNALCSAYPGAVIRITAVDSGKELAGESPYKCKRGIFH